MRSRILIALCAMALLALPMTMGCGGGGGGGGDSSVTYDGNTSPAVADSTNTSQITENMFNTVSAGFPLAQVFAYQPQEPSQPLAAGPLSTYSATTVTIPIPSGAVLSGSDYAEFGTGTATLSGTMELHLYNNISDTADTWTVEYVSMAGEITFDGFRADNSGPTLSGRAAIIQGDIDFSNDVNFLLSTMDFDGEPGLPYWQNVEMTFSKLTLDDEGDILYLGEGSWVIAPGGGYVDLEIHSMTVQTGAKTYKMEDTLLYVEFSSQGDTNYVSTSISGTDDGDYGTFYDYDHGRIYIAGDVSEQDPPNEIVGGSIFLSQDGLSDDASVGFGYSEAYGKTFYNVRVGFDLVEKGWVVDGVFIPDPSAPNINT